MSLRRTLVAITGHDAKPLDGFQILFRSTGSKVAARIARERIDHAHQAAATGVMGAGHPSERAAPFLSLVAGFQLMRQMMGLDLLAKVDPAVLVGLAALARLRLRIMLTHKPHDR